MVKIKQQIIPESKWDIKCPYTMKAEYITIHNTANDTSAQNEVDYMTCNNNEVSFHYAVDDTQAIQAIPTNRNAWHAGDGSGKGNRASIGIEICYSECGGDKYNKAEDNAAELTAQLLQKHGFGIDRVKQHNNWSGKNCPHRIREEGTWDSFLNKVQSYMNVEAAPPTESEQSETTYRVYANGKWYGWITGYNNSNSNGYAGVVGAQITGVQIKGDVEYRVRTTDGKWWDWIKGYNTTNSNGYAGTLKKPIDAIQIKNKTYRVSPVKSNYLGWITHYNTANSNGYAGIYGKPIDRLQIK